MLAHLGRLAPIKTIQATRPRSLSPCRAIASSFSQILLRGNDGGGEGDDGHRRKTRGSVGRKSTDKFMVYMVSRRIFIWGARWCSIFAALARAQVLDFIPQKPRFSLIMRSDRVRTCESRSFSPLESEGPPLSLFPFLISN